MNRKVRADHLLVERGLASSGAEARSLLLAGRVFGDGRRIDKGGTFLSRECVVEIQQRPHPWVSRGGVKLAFALDRFGMDPDGATAIDVGASTGGFTDVLLTRGVRRVYAVDVGYGQLAWKLRQDPRVVVLERTNARYLGSKDIPEPVDLVVCDASFIGLAKVLAAPLAFARPGAGCVALIKPQFEAGPSDVGKGGVVRDPGVRHRVCEAIRTWFIESRGWEIRGLEESPVRGARGNVEYLIAASRPRETGRPA